MSLRFRRRIKIIPGVHLNISRSGISTSVGVRGASLTLGKQGTYLNTGIPGTGVSWRGRISEPASTKTTQPISEPLSTEAVPTLKHTHHIHWWKISHLYTLHMFHLDNYSIQKNDEGTILSPHRYALHLLGSNGEYSVFPAYSKANSHMSRATYSFSPMQEGDIALTRVILAGSKGSSSK